MSSENNKEVMSVEQIAKAYAEEFAGKMDQSLIDENVQALKSMTTGTEAVLSIIMLLAYARVDVYAGDMHFTGNAIGQFLAIPVGSMMGSVITNNESELYRDTSAFTISLAAAGAGGVVVYFHNSHLKLLGTFVGVGAAAGEGSGAGPGNWKNA